MILLIPILQWCRTNLGNKEIIRMIPKGEVIVGKLSIINNKLKRSKEVDNVKGQKKFNKWEIIFYMTKINEKKKKTKVCFFPNEK